MIKRHRRLLLLSRNCRPQAKEKTMRVAIIGGGCAAAGALEILGANPKIQEIVVFEAASHWGGRAWTRKVDEAYFDMGPQFVQDPGVTISDADPTLKGTDLPETANPWLKIIKKLNTANLSNFTCLQIDPTTYYRVPDGAGGWQDVFTTNDINQVNNTIDTDFQFAATKPNLPASVTYQSGGPFAGTVHLALGSNGYGPIAESVETWQYIAADSDRQVAPAGEQPNIYVAPGIGDVVGLYMNVLTNPAEGSSCAITGNLKTKVLSIQQGSNQIKIDTENGSFYGFDFCIVTISPYALANIAFTPPLPAEKIKALKYIGLGNYKKIGIYADNIPESIKMNTEYYTIDLDGQSCWQYFRNPHFKNLLIGVASGNFARTLETMDKEQVRDRFTAVIKSRYGDVTLNITDWAVTNWANEPRIGGAYSYTIADGGPADDPFPLQARDLLQTTHQNIFFAGEADWTEAYGTIHGAYYSGQRAANALLNRL
ncbi:NAD(P)-binding protein [Niveispirillum sp. SYP-B3756]|uniref:flavin monoamine oxidase family protein n=1 Tax=Niveispirillum sp. SYP-B3756 TaxID=2662178 RepID=UPI0012924BD4|nr:NAD(P)/FAD-dependent oxidoreductase [Niveispirillum sp. SYP-B3756]MQP68117.1 NAD(P)-binding protein [Niveispirillum sp. SYP-B3756]